MSPRNGACDAAETCTGSSTTCPTDVNVAAGTVCRAANGACDVAEACSGSSSACPADVFASSSTTCRAVAGVCDKAETCSGSSVSCPADTFLSAGTSCRAATNECDQAETCTGASNSCPSDSYKAAGAACTDDGNVCTSDVCTVATAQGLSVTYFANTDLTGSSVTRIDSTVDFNFANTSPDPAISTVFSARWTGQVLAPNTGSYTFEVEADDGIRLSIDGVLLVDKWISQGATNIPRPSRSPAAPSTM